LIWIQFFCEGLTINSKTILQSLFEVLSLLQITFLSAFWKFLYFSFRELFWLMLSSLCILCWVSWPNFLLFPKCTFNSANEHFILYIHSQITYMQISIVVEKNTLQLKTWLWLVLIVCCPSLLYHWMFSLVTTVWASIVLTHQLSLLSQWVKLLALLCVWCILLNVVPLEHWDRYNSLYCAWNIW